MSIIAFLVIGIIAGWIAGKIMKGKGFGLFGDLGVGVLGAMIGGFIFHFFGFFAFGFIGNLVTAVVGAVVFLYILRLFKSS